MRQPLLVLFGSLIAAAHLAAQQPEPRHVGRERELSDLTLVRSGDGIAAVRFGTGALETVRAGDRLGRHRAEITEIVAGRLTAMETFPGKDGRPNRAQVIWADGERGGRRYVKQLDHAPAPATKPAAKPPGR